MYTAVKPEAQWGWNEIFLNRIMYHLDTLVWMKTKDAQKKLPRHRPKLFTPNFMPQQSEPGAISQGAEVHETEDIRAILSRKRVNK